MPTGKLLLLTGQALVSVVQYLDGGTQSLLRGLLLHLQSVPLGSYPF